MFQEINNKLNETSFRTKVIVTTIIVAVSFATGRYTVPETVRTVIQTVEVEKKTTDTETSTKTDTHTMVVVIEKPDGSKETTTTTIDKSITDSIDKSVEDKTIVSKEIEEITKNQDKVIISILAGYDVSKSQLTFGGAVTKPILGSITIGLFGLSSGQLGGSVGVQF